MTQLRRAQRALVPVVGLSLAAGALLGTSGSASADTVADISGVVTNAAGAPLSNAFVRAFVQSGSQFFQVDTATTDATGRYELDDLDAATRATVYDGTSAGDVAIRGASSFKLQFSRDVPDAELHTNPGYLTRSYGGAKSLSASTPVALSPSGATTANLALPSAGGMIVKITGATGAPVSAGGYANLYAADAVDPINAYETGDGTARDDAFYDNPATPVDEGDDAPQDGLAYVYGIEPGSYAVDAGGADVDATTGAFRSYLSRFVGGNGTYADATPITVTAGSFASTGVQLSDRLTALESPRILGNSSFGSTLIADPGTWLRQQGTEFSYQWTRGGVAVPGATKATYAVTKADKKKKIGLVVTAVATELQNSSTVTEFVGSAVAKSTSKVGEKSKVTVKKAGKGSYAVTVKVAKKKLATKLGTPKGKVVLVTEDGHKASKAVKLKAGKATLTVRSKYAGEKLTVVYLGGGKLGSDDAAIKGGKKK